MAQSVWHRDDIGRIAATLIAMAPSPDFAAGVPALAHAMGADVRLSQRPVTVDVVMIDASKEVTR